MGYSAMPEEQFERFAHMAAMAVQKFSNRRLGRFRTPVAELSDGVKRGMCEICDIYYLETQHAGGKIAGFANDGYREQYFEGAGVNKRVFEIIQLYFPKGQIFRGVEI